MAMAGGPASVPSQGRVVEMVSVADQDLLLKVFSAVDKTSRGWLGSDELHDAYQAIGISTDKAELERWVTSVSKRGLIGRTDFIKLAVAQAKPGCTDSGPSILRLVQGFRGKVVSQDEPKDIKELPKPKPGAPVVKLKYGGVGAIGSNAVASGAPSAIIKPLEDAAGAKRMVTLAGNSNFDDSLLVKPDDAQARMEKIDAAEAVLTDSQRMVKLDGRSSFDDSSMVRADALKDLAAMKIQEPISGAKALPKMRRLSATPQEADSSIQEPNPHDAQKKIVNHQRKFPEYIQHHTLPH